MDANEALAYCIHFVDDKPEDGHFLSQTVYDRNGTPHWVRWEVSLGDWASPLMSSECNTPFAKALEPYRTHQEERD